MPERAAHLRRDRAIRMLPALFFVSGATALAYQVIWLRQLQLVFGTSTFAISTLLAAFMAGLAMGGIAISRTADRLRRPLAIYGIIELGVGLYALVFPWLVEVVTPVYLGAWRALEPGPVMFGFIQAMLIGTLLLPPTGAMGATLPLLAHFATRRLGSAGSRVGVLYAANTIGAAAGIGMCGFVLLPLFGITRTTLTAIAANLLLGFAVLMLQRRVAEGEQPIEDDPGVPEASASVIVAVSVAIGIAGFAALVYEVAWTRLLALMLGSSAYIFSVMLIAFLSGIALGGKLGGRYADRLLVSGGTSRVLYAFAVIEIGIAVLAYVTMYAYPELPIWYVGLFDQFGAGHLPVLQWWVSLLLAGLVMTPPAVLMGMHFPMAVRAVVGNKFQLGRQVGIIYGVNALGAALGAFLAGFALLPNQGMQGTIFIACLAGLLAAGILVLCAAHGSRRYWILACPIVLAGFVFLFATRRPPWNPLLITSGMYRYVSNFEDHSREGILRYSVDLYELLYYEEGLSSVVTVAQNVGSSHRWIAINGKVDASTTDDMPTQVLLSVLPMQFVEQPEDVLVIGLASGVTAGVLSLLARVETLQIVELEPAVGRAARYFDAWNHSVLSDPRVELVHNDGRNYLMLADPASYDMIISEPSNPWISGVANLFTREFLELGKSRLRPGGVWSQWVPIYGMDSRDLRSILRTFGDVYPYVAVYTTIEYNDLVLIGSDSPLMSAANAARRVFGRPSIAAELQRAHINSAAKLASMFVMDRAGIVGLSEGVPLNTDDNMHIEYSTSRKLHLEARRENFELLLQYPRFPVADD